MRKEKSFQNLILFSFVIFNLYYGYRYLLRYNSTMTSPTYSDTPMAFQLLKYAIALIIIVAIICLLFTGDIKLKFGAVEGLLLTGMAFCFIKALQFRDIDFLVRNYIFIFCAYAIMFVKDGKFERRLIGINKFLFLYHVIYSFVQIAAYIFLGRLPALAYEGGLVRFGGGWDDPNAFAFYLLLPACYSMIRFIFEKSRKRQTFYLFVFFISLVLELLTFSFTGYLMFAIAALFMLVRYRGNARLLILAVICVACLILGFIVFQDKLISILSMKSGSLAIHFEMMRLQFPKSLSGLLFGGSQYAFYENMYNILLTNYGLLYFLCAVGLRIYFIYIAYKVCKKYRTNPSYFLGLIYVVCFTVGQVALPFSLIFPINYFYWIFTFLFLNKYRRLCTKKKLIKPILSMVTS